MRLLKRSAECEALDQLLADAAAGRSRVAVLRGEAGEGKTTLLDYLAERVQSWNVATAVGVESEVELDYSGRHQLCTTPCAGCPSPRRRGARNSRTNSPPSIFPMAPKRDGDEVS